MKKSKIITLASVAFVSVLLIAVGCDSPSPTNTNDNTNNSNISIIITNTNANDNANANANANGNTNSSSNSGEGQWIGTWILSSESANTPAGSVTNPGFGTVLEIKDDGTATEDYSALSGYGACDDTSGAYEGTWEYDANNDYIVFDHAAAVKLVDPYIACGDYAGTNAVPRSLIAFGYGTSDWVLDMAADGNSFLATITSPAGTTNAQNWVKQ